MNSDNDIADPEEEPLPEYTGGRPHHELMRDLEIIQYEVRMQTNYENRGSEWNGIIDNIDESLQEALQGLRDLFLIKEGY